MIEFEIVGEPVGKGRPRFSTLNGHAVAFTPAKTANYENLVKISYQQKYAGLVISAGVPIVAHIDAYFTIPKSTSKKARAEMLSGKRRPTKKPDADNIIKSVLDALNGIAYHDDSQVVGVIINKYYSDTPKVVVKISPTVEYLVENIT